MPRKVTATEAKARLVPATGAQALRGAYAGLVMSVADEEEDLFTTGATWNLE